MHCMPISVLLLSIKHHEAFVCICVFRILFLNRWRGYSPPHTLALEQEDMIGRVAIRIDWTRLISRLWKILLFLPV